MNNIIAKIFSISSAAEFEQSCMQIFRHQALNCQVYRDYIYHLGIHMDAIENSLQIPYLPIGFFKSHKVVSNELPSAITFSSSGTTGQSQSQHFVTDVEVYNQSFTTAFEQFYGKIEGTCFLALLPSYLEREGSSLIYMVDALIRDSKHAESGYYLHNHEDLYHKLIQLKAKRQKTILIGVTYALLDFIEQYQLSFPELIVMETGGMKGKRKEMVREELHEQLQRGFGVNAIHSEYGMTELLGQAYSDGSGIFRCPPWMQIHLRDTNDPLSAAGAGKSGGINVIDLSNINSCAFIATQDLGRLMPDGSFEVLGRFDNADIRGCNLLVN